MRSVAVPPDLPRRAFSVFWFSKCPHASERKACFAPEQCPSAAAFVLWAGVWGACGPSVRSVRPWRLALRRITQGGGRELKRGRRCMRHTSVCGAAPSEATASTGARAPAAWSCRLALPAGRRRPDRAARAQAAPRHCARVRAQQGHQEPSSSRCRNKRVHDGVWPFVCMSVSAHIMRDDSRAT